VDPIAETHANAAVAAQATPSTSAAAALAGASQPAPDRRAQASNPVRSWAGRERGRGRRAGAAGGDSGPVCSALLVRLGSLRIGAHTAAVVDAGADEGGMPARAGAGIESGGVVSLWIWVGGVRALGLLCGWAGAGSGAAAKDVFVGGVALGAGRFWRGPGKEESEDISGNLQ
jgi:hypothetical protein